VSFTTELPEPSATVTRPLRPAVATRRPPTVTRVPRRRWAILSRVGPSVRTAILPVRNRAAALYTMSRETSVKAKVMRDAAAARVPSFQLSEVLVPGSG
jgi:hypothetical protein